MAGIAVNAINGSVRIVEGIGLTRYEADHQGKNKYPEDRSISHEPFIIITFHNKHKLKITG